MSREFSRLRKYELASLLVRIESYVDHALRSQSEIVDNDPTWKGLRGLHAQSLIGILNDVERIGRSGAGRTEIYVDETREFRPVLEAALRRKKRESFGEHVISNDLVIRKGYISFPRLSFVRSQDHIIIQAADILAALLANQLRNPEVFAKSSDGLAEMTKSLIDLSEQDNNAAKLVVSKPFSRRLE